jgi:mitogen-activated protein kinase kinase
MSSRCQVLTIVPLLTRFYFQLLLKRRALKITDVSNETLEEIRLLKKLNDNEEEKCPHIIEYIDDFGIFGIKRCIVTEYCSNGDLDQIIQDFHKAKKKIDIDQITYWNWGILGGIDYLHSKKIIHRDIKPK